MRIFQLYGLAAVALMALSGPALAEGDATKGKAAFAKCGICHQVGPGAKTLVGPELNGIVGRKAASVADYPYSPGMKKLGEEGFTWTDAESRQMDRRSESDDRRFADGARLSRHS